MRLIDILHQYEQKEITALEAARIIYDDNVLLYRFEQDYEQDKVLYEEISNILDDLYTQARLDYLDDL
jgi:hypothetical protein